MGRMECLIVDDCSMDESIPIAERMIAEYDGLIRFEILHHEHNRGISAARNTGMEKAMGEYILFIDCDDEITGDCVEKMMAVVREHPEVELVQGRCIRHKDGQKTHFPNVIKITHASTNDEVRSCFYRYRQVFVAAWNKLIKRSLIVDNRLSFMEGLQYEDIPWTFNWLKYIKNAFFLDDVTYHYKIRPGSIVTGTAKEEEEIYRIKGYHDMVTNLTPGYEKQEIEYYTLSFVELFLRHSYHMPELIEDLNILWHYAWESREYKLCGALAICYVFRRSKWLGRIVFSFALRLKHPGRIPKDFVRLRRWIERKMKA